MLDWAINHRIPDSSLCPKGRSAEDGPIGASCPLNAHNACLLSIAWDACQCDELEILRDTCLRQTPITKGITCYAPYLLDETIYKEAQLREILSGVSGIIL